MIQRRSSACVPASVGRLTWPLVLLLGIAAALGTGQSAADTLDPSYIYGIADNNDIYQINPDQKTFGVVYNTGLSGQSNAFAFDRNRDQMFFINPSGTFAGTPYTNGLFLWNKPAGSFSLLAANGSSFGITGATIPANAAYHNNAFWFFNEGSLSLTRANLTYSGTGAGAVPTGVASVQAFTMATGTSLTAGQNRFGDIAINAITNTLFGYTAQAQGGRFYSLALSDPTSASSFTMISGSSAIGLQLSFDEDYSKLYGHNYANGRWYEINTSSGALTDLNFITTTNGTTGFRDLGGSSIVAVPEPASATLAFTAAAATAGWWVLRRRKSG
jgi:hypothetical protein